MTAIEGGQAGALVVAGAGLFLLIPLAWFLLTVGLVGAVLLMVIEHRTRPARTDTIVETDRPDDPETDGA